MTKSMSIVDGNYVKAEEFTGKYTKIDVSNNQQTSANDVKTAKRIS